MIVAESRVNCIARTESRHPLPHDVSQLDLLAVQIIRVPPQVQLCPHLPFDAQLGMSTGAIPRGRTHLLRDSNHHDRPRSHHDPKEDARRERLCEVRREDEVYEGECERKVEYMGRPADEVIQRRDAARQLYSCILRYS